MAHPKHQEVRRRFDYCCGYCGVSEANTGGELTVDHYRPVAAGGDDSDDNLIYACFRCNLYKGDYWPNAQEEAAGFRILHPLHDDLTIHLRENPECLLEGVTATGQFHIATLELNRPPLVAHRQVRNEASAQRAQNHLLEAIIEFQDHTMQGMADYIARLRQLVNNDSTPKQDDKD